MSVPALAEEAAASEASKRGTPFGSGAFAWAADMLPTATLIEPVRTVEPRTRRIVDIAAPKGRSVLPLLEPPTA